MTSFNASNGPWLKPGIEARLCELHAEGHSFREIAEKLSAEYDVTLTKNAIAGRCHRLCLKLRVKPRAYGPKEIRKRKPKHRKSEFDMIEIKPIEPIEPEPVEEFKPHLEGIDLLDLQFDDCRFPFGEHPHIRYCGKPQFRRSYCCEHFEKSYVVPKMRWGG